MSEKLNEMIQKLENVKGFLKYWETELRTEFRDTHDHMDYEIQLDHLNEIIEDLRRSK
jgi:exonuclease VII small subunit